MKLDNTCHPDASVGMSTFNAVRRANVSTASAKSWEKPWLLGSRSSDTYTVDYDHMNPTSDNANDYTASDQPDWGDSPSPLDHDDDCAQVSSSSSTTTSTTTRVSAVSPLNDSLSAANPVNDEHEKILRGNGGDLNKYFIGKFDLKATSAYYDIHD